VVILRSLLVGPASGHILVSNGPIVVILELLLVDPASIHTLVSKVRPLQF